MKKLNFTSGLMLAMLFLGANAGNAIYYHGAPHSGAVQVSFSAAQSDGYATDKAVILQQIAVDREMLFNYPFIGSQYYWPASELQKRGLHSPSDLITWNYGCPIKDDNIYRLDYYLNENRTTPGFLNYYYHSKAYTGIAGLFYYAVKSRTEAYNRLEVNMRYASSDATPVIKRTIRYGEWKTIKYNTEYAYNEITPLSLSVTHSLRADSTLRRSNYTSYIFRDQLIPLLSQYVIYSIHYEVTFENHTLPPITINHAVNITADKGITTVPALGGPIFVESNYDFVFKVYSDKDITVTTSRGRDAEGVMIVKNYNGTFGVTIRRVTSNMTIYIRQVPALQSGIDESSQTGNETVASDDAVWAADGVLYVRTPNPGMLSVFTIAGQLYKQLPVDGNQPFNLPKGIYIVLLNGKTYKVVL